MRYPNIVLSLVTCMSLTFTSLTSYAATQASPDIPDFSTRKALLIGVDGMQFEKLQEAIAQAMAPNLASLNLNKSYVGGVDGTSIQQQTFSGPGWATILTGGWVDRHKIGANNGALRSNTPSLFKQLKTADPQRKTASIVSWNTINDNFADDIAQGYIDLAEKCSDIDQCVADKASQELEFGQYDLVFAHFDEPDLAGHSNGFSAKYQLAIKGVDAQIGQLLAALERRKQAYPNEDWLVMVTPDHGRRLPNGSSHGQQSLSEKTTFIAMNKPGNPQLTAPIPDPVNPGYNGLYGFASQADITPTLLTHLGAKPDLTQYSIDGLPLIGPLGVRQLTAQSQPTQAQVTLTWRTGDPSGKPLQIYRNGQPIAALTDHYSQYVDEVQGLSGALNYTVVIDDVPVSRLVTLAN